VFLCACSLIQQYFALTAITAALAFRAEVVFADRLLAFSTEAQAAFSTHHAGCHFVHSDLALTAVATAVALLAEVIIAGVFCAGHADL
jgi:hypothetical protein